MQILASVIIPVLNDREAVSSLLRTFPAFPGCEVIVVEAGGRAGDAAPPPADAIGALPLRWIEAPPGRGRQMNDGARLAVGRWLVFLHADTRLPARWLDEIRLADASPSLVAGCFRFAVDSTDVRARVIEWGVRVRVRWFGLPYGDQGIFVRRSVFEESGGYRELPLMEDVDLIRRLRRRGKLLRSALPAVTSARRWERDGWFRRSAENLLLVSLFLLGVSPERLARRYHGLKSGAARRHPS